MRILISIFFIAALSFNAGAQTKRWRKASFVSRMNFPLILSNIKIRDSMKPVLMDTTVESKIDKIINSYYFDECGGDSSESYFSRKDIYYGTIQLSDSLETLYLILLKHIPGEQLNSKVIFYNNISKTFADTIIDFNIYASYDISNGKLNASNLKKQFNITVPDIQLVDYDHDKINDYKFTRLYHNGTLNAIETFILKVNNGKVERLSFERKSLE